MKHLKKLIALTALALAMSGCGTFAKPKGIGLKTIEGPTFPDVTFHRVEGGRFLIEEDYHELIEFMKGQWIVIKKLNAQNRIFNE